MKIELFRAGEGEAILVRGNGKALLVDGGSEAAYQQYIAPALTTPGRAFPIERLCVSTPAVGRIDGIRQLVEDVLAWRVFDYQRTVARNKRYRRPVRPRPPVLGGVWCNSVQEILGATTTALQEQLAIYARWRGRADGSSATERLVASLHESRTLTRRLVQLRIPLNSEFDGGLIYARKSFKPLAVGPMQVHIIGPLPVDVERSRADWRRWFQVTLQAQERLLGEPRPTASSAFGAVAPVRQASSLMFDPELPSRLPTIPSLPSLILLVKERDSSMLMTGDATADDVVKGLAAQGWFDSGEHARVDVLQIPSRGSAQLARGELFGRVVADHYVFAGSGAMANTSPEAIEALFAARLREAMKPDGRPFALWFACNSASARPEQRADIEALQSLVERHVKASRGNATCTFMPAGAAALQIMI
ncbi:MAG: hypothetical protein ACM32G_00505 [Betaproteobacteria bacterium]